MNNTKLILKALFQFIKALLSIILYILRFIFKLLDKIIDEIVNKLRFSISFKITVTYVLIFILVSSIMSTGIYFSFEYYIKTNSPADYIYVLGAILFAFNIIGLTSIIFIGSRASKKLINPVKVMTETVKEISINALDKRLNISGSKDELKDLAKTFNDMLDRIQVSIEQQNQFVSDASHELRTPISVIQGYANLLDRWGKDDKQVLEESISAIKSESENMKNLVENLLFLARGDKNTQKIEKQLFIMSEVITEVLKETRLIDNIHSITNKQNEKYTIKADKWLIKEALRIFIDNSVKYTPAGGSIRLNSYIKNNSAIISIEDTGIGIPEEDLPHIFNRFYRSDKSRTKKSGGTGLGLAIAKWIIDKHDGKINVWSEVNTGTAIRIELPIEEVIYK
ncbi:sensor histidine kinase [Brassicibacter mesophilus]|uniref:sensor histidine kinase n=1 Tax=Brassicibacter mesophilus TaxID=745119 RepID=UPI003D21E201